LDLRFKKIEPSGKNPDKSVLPGKGTIIAYHIIREVLPFIKIDRPIYPHLETLQNLIERNTILDGVEKEVGQLE
ncbi:MAG: hypothetical protein P8Y60_19465, partial [Calditrichota bacterium]